MYCVQTCKNNKNNKCHSIENCQHQWSNPIELIADHYGLKHQTEKLLEELRELIEAIEQNKSIEELTTELVDVPIMCEQVVYLHEVEEEAKTEREFKILRQLGRIQKELEETKGGTFKVRVTENIGKYSEKYIGKAGSVLRVVDGLLIGVSDFTRGYYGFKSAEDINDFFERLIDVKTVFEAFEESEQVTVTELESDEYYCMWYKCSGCTCISIMDSFNYCPECGKKIDWGEW